MRTMYLIILNNFDTLSLKSLNGSIKKILNGSINTVYYWILNQNLLLKCCLQMQLSRHIVWYKLTVGNNSNTLKFIWIQLSFYRVKPFHLLQQLYKRSPCVKLILDILLVEIIPQYHISSVSVNTVVWCVME